MAAVFVAPVRTTVKVTLFVSSATLRVLTVNATLLASSSSRVTTLVPKLMVVLVALLRRMRKVSFVSCVWSSVMVRTSVLVVTPGAKVKRPFVAA